MARRRNDEFVTQGSVLIVEDERHVARLIEYFLTKAGYTVISADSAERALDLIQSRQPQALILDLILPGMSGLEFLALLRQNASLAELKIIVLTAHWFASDDTTLEEAGANAHCSKPVSPTTLIRTLTDLGVTPGVAVRV